MPINVPFRKIGHDTIEGDVNPSEVRHLQDYLTEVRIQDSWKRFFGSSLAQFVLPAALAIALYFLIFRRMGGWIFLFVFFGAGHGMFQGFTKWIQQRADSMAWNKAVHDARQRALSEQMRELAKKGILASRIHPEVGRALNATAEAAMEVRSLLVSEKWEDLARSTHWRDIRKSSIIAVDEGMHDAMSEAQPFVRMPGMTKADFEKMVQRDPHAASTVAKIQALTQKLRTLHDGLVGAYGLSAQTKLDRALEDLHSVRQAENELDELRH